MVLKKTLVIFLPVMLLAFMMTAFFLYASDSSERKAFRFAQRHTVSLQVSGISHDLADISAVLQIFVNSQNVKNLWDDEGNAIADVARQLTEDFLNVARFRKSFNQIRLIDEHGMETIRVNYNNGIAEVVPKSKLQNKKGRYYFDDAFILWRGDVFVSPLDLNIEHGEIEIPLKPMIRFAAPIFDPQGHRRGIVLLNYFGKELISRFTDHESITTGTQAMILNSDGYWIKGPVAEDEWGFMFAQGKDKTFGRDYPDAWKLIKSAGSEQIETDAGLFTFETVYPLREGQISYPGLAQSVVPHHAALNAEEYSWKVISFVPKDVLNATLYSRIQISAWILLGLAFFVFVSSWRFARVSVMEKMAEQKLIVHYSALNAAGDSVLITNQAGEIEWINLAISELTGYSSIDLEAQHISKLLDTSSEAMKDIEEALTTQKSWHGELICRHKNGVLFSAGTSLTPVSNDAGQVKNFIAIIRDLTEKKTLQTQLLAAQKMESIGQLAAGIAHEINTPTQFVGDNVHFLKDVIDDCLSMLQKLQQLEHQLNNKEISLEQVLPVLSQLLQQADVEYISDEAPAAIDQSLEGLARIAKIVGAMKDFSHPGSSGKEIVDLNNIIETTVTIARNEWRYAAELELDLADDMPNISADPQLLGQAMLNFIVNAAHAVAEKLEGRNEKGLISISTRCVNDRIEIRVSDNGTGIPEEIRRRIFEPFFTTKEVGKGSGQGLAIAYSGIVEKHKGSIDIDSDLGKGSTFIIRLPVGNPDSD